MGVNNSSCFNKGQSNIFESCNVDSPREVFDGGFWIKSSDLDECNQNESLEYTGEVALFRAVIMQALVDSVNKSSRTEDKLAKRQAIEWFDIENHDFTTVCELARLNPAWVIKRSVEAIANGCKWKRSQQQKISS